MTMDVSNRKLELKSDVQINTNCDEQTNITPIKVVKRPFDVAFLMLPDDKLKQKQSRIIKGNFEKLEVSYNNNDSVEEDEEIEVGTNQEFVRTHQKYFTQKQQIFDDPNLIKAKNLDELRSKVDIPTSSEQKSAFTKVNLASKDLRLSPNLSISPDLSYQNSLSPSPPIINRNYQNVPANMLSPSQLFKTQQISAYQNSFLPENFNPSSNLDNPFLIKNPNDLIQPNFPKMRPMYRPELPYNYQQFPNQEMLKIATPEMRNPAAAILTSLLPPSLAALSLPAQNVCAKCNISFRMTSDLVYHMRSHHKNDSMDMHKRRREEKLKCPVCSESFRERHHLTRHMTAHQDKDEDEGNVKKKCIPSVH
ncbi:uncharacterized protein [Tenebrio molitor]|jgi:uncharacterized C2H2 Zn-finger protein|uniref:uncharacterized protein n=1 Tax=Tenebrio molitor TaxID=7067 RepID=UPI001C3B5A7F|nr:unnamed protein product [Tenebrio molitor]